MTAILCKLQDYFFVDFNNFIMISNIIYNNLTPSVADGNEIQYSQVEISEQQKSTEMESQSV